MAVNLNKVMLLGNLTADPESRVTTSGQPVVNLRMATNRKWMDKSTQEFKESTEFHDVVVWGKLADWCSKLVKGQKIFVEGRIQTRSWEDQAGVKKYRTEVIAENVISL